MAQHFRFNELENNVPSTPGIYEIHMFSGQALKVGVGGNLLERLKGHRASRQSGLKLKPNGDWNNPKCVVSKGSILAKHLYYDSSIAQDYDLTSEQGRRHFLEEQCYLVFETTANKDEAEKREKVCELRGNFRYVGDVLKR